MNSKLLRTTSAIALAALSVTPVSAQAIRLDIGHDLQVAQAAHDAPDAGGDKNDKGDAPADPHKQGRRGGDRGGGENRAQPEGGAGESRGGNQQRGERRGGDGAARGQDGGGQDRNQGRARERGQDNAQGRRDGEPPTTNRPPQPDAAKATTPAIINRPKTVEQPVERPDTGPARNSAPQRPAMAPRPNAVPPAHAPVRDPAQANENRPPINPQADSDTRPRRNEGRRPNDDRGRPDDRSPPTIDRANNPGSPPARPRDGFSARPGDGRPPAHVLRDLNEAKSGRIERREDGGKRLVIVEPDQRRIVRQGDRVIIEKDETAQLRRVAPGAVVTRDARGRNRAVVRRNNIDVITETDRNGQLLRRYRRDNDGRETVIIDNRRRKDNFGRNLAVGVGVGAGIIAGAAILNSVVDVPPPVVRVPRNKYIVDYERASEDDVYEALSAPPVDRIDRRYTLDQVRATHYLRDRMRRVDLDDITFDTGSWDINPGQYRKLERIARAMRRVIDRNPNEVFLIEGYTDAVGSDVDNLTLSDRRAEAVSVVLTEEFGVPFENLTTQGYGEQYLKIQTQAPERENRRVAARRITPLLGDGSISEGPPPPPDRYNDDRRGGYDDEGPRDRRWRRYN